ncbi:TPA: hypothetical protein DF272_03945 [Candidatus Falkowbacteria bacterium]|nr:hypothetical protein [Candidatus Falkowbacteria bacterium]
MFKSPFYLNDYVVDLRGNTNCLGAILTGSYGRCDFDVLSDIDIVVIVKKTTKNIPHGKYYKDNKLFDVRIITLKQFLDEWSCEMFFAFWDERIIYDRQKNLKQIIAIKKEYWKKEIVGKIINKFVALSVILEFSDDWRGLKTTTHLSKFLLRKDYFSAQQLLSYCFDSILDLVYLLNIEPYPDSKNKIRLLKGLSWVPWKNNEELQSLALFCKFNRNAVIKREKNFSKIKKELIKYTDGQFNLPVNLYQHYLENRI